MCGEQDIYSRICKKTQCHVKKKKKGKKCGESRKNLKSLKKERYYSTIETVASKKSERRSIHWGWIVKGTAGL